MKRFALGLLYAALSLVPAHARDGGQWAQVSPERKQFFNDAKMPDSPRQSCCGEADAYEADDFDSDPDGTLVAIITCNEPDVITGQDKHGNPVGYCSIEGERTYDNDGDKTTVPARPPGTRIRIPAEKILKPHKPENLTKHGWVFLGSDDRVYCYEFGFGN